MSRLDKNTDLEYLFWNKTFYCFVTFVFPGSAAAEGSSSGRDDLLMDTFGSVSRVSLLVPVTTSLATRRTDLVPLSLSISPNVLVQDDRWHFSIPSCSLWVLSGGDCSVRPAPGSQGCKQKGSWKSQGTPMILRKTFIWPVLDFFHSID